MHPVFVTVWSQSFDLFCAISLIFYKRVKELFHTLQYL